MPMQPLLALLTASLLLGGGAASTALLAGPGGFAPGDVLLGAPFARDAPASAGARDHGAHDHGAHDHGAAWAEDGDGFPVQHRVPWPAAEGRVPTEQDAKSRLREVRTIVVASDRDFARLEGVFGRGTPEAPYVFDGLYVPGDLHVADTDRHFVVRNSYIGGQLTLNWVGDRAHVHHNHIRDLRVNENVPRTGAATAGLLEHNVVGFVGQLRHFDGVFRDNTVGPRPPGFFEEALEDSGFSVPFFQDDLAFNFDGFNGAEVVRNVIAGSVDIGFHGHHHSNGFVGASHNHGPGARAMDHGDRWHSLKFADNVITVAGGRAALRLEDDNHAGDDRTAASEREPSLEGPHTHRTLMLVLRNTLHGGHLLVDIFNAEDRYHHAANLGALVLRANDVTLTAPERGARPEVDAPGLRERPRDGILVREARDFDLLVEGNTVRNRVPAREGPAAGPLALLPLSGGWLGERAPAGVRLAAFEAGQAVLRGNVLDGFPVGFHARDFADDVRWALEANQVRGAAREVDYDDSVAQPPEGADGGGPPGLPG